MIANHISTETAKLAKEKGFPQGENSGIYHTEPRDHNTGDRGQYINHERFLIVEQYLLQKWLREEHKINVESNYLANIGKYRALYKPMSIIPKGFQTYGEYREGVAKYYGTKNHNTYEEALEEALQEALKLI